MKRVLITGAAGFVASHMVEHVLAKTDWHVIGLDSFRHRGDPVRIESHMDPKRYDVHFCDLSAPIGVRLMEKIGPVDFMVNVASDSHVERSIDDPVRFVNNNVNLSLNMLEYARWHMANVPTPLQSFIQISTDEVFGAAPLGMEYREWDRLLPSNPYAASKAAQEALTIAYWRTYGVPAVITNTMNIFGQRQDPEKFIPMVIGKIFREEEVTIHGSETSIGSRFYLHARNQADAILWILKNRDPIHYEDRPGGTVYPERFNVVGDIEMNNLEVAQMIARIMGRPLHYKLVDFHKARPGHDRRYGLDGTKLAMAGWKAPRTFEESLRSTIEWTLKHPEWLR